MGVPIHALTVESVRFEWNKETYNAFKILKERLSSSPILAFTDDTKPFVIDASEVAVGAALMHNQNSGRYHPVHYASRSFFERGLEVQKIGTRGSGGCPYVEEASQLLSQWIISSAQ